MSDKNPWELYSSVAGWEACSHRLDEAMAVALKALDAHVADGKTIPKAALDMYSWMLKVMGNNANEKYGATDSEPCNRMMDIIETHIQDRYGVTVDL